MKRFGMTLAALAMFFVMTAATGLANGKDREKEVRYTEDVMLNGTLLKAGTYMVKFDAKTNEVTFRRDGKVVAKTKAAVQVNENKAPYNSTSFVNTDKGKMISSLTFSGDRRTLLLNETGTAPAGE